MKISTKGLYAVRFMLNLAEHGGDKLVSLKEVSEAESVSKKYLEQIVPNLVSAQLVKSVRGAAGGYRLARPASDITVLDVHTAYLHSGYDMPGELGTLHDWRLCKGYLLDFFQGLEHLPLPGEIGGYRDSILLAPLAYRQPTAPAGLHTPAPFHQPLLLIGSL